MTPIIAPESRWTELLAHLSREAGLAPFMRAEAAQLLFARNGALLHRDAAGAALAGGGLPPATAKRVAQLAEGLAPMGGVRLERLVFSGGDGAEPFTCACRRIALEDAEVLLVAVQGAAQRLSRAMPDLDESPSVHADGPPSIPVAAQPANPADEAGAAIEVLAPEAVLKPLAAKVRFLWEIDADGTILSVSPEAIEVFGQALADEMIGGHWSALCGRVVHDPDEAVARALAADRTWSGKPSLWRIGGGDTAYRVTLSGLPLTDSARRLTGWRGFGIVQTDAVEAFPALPAAEPDEAPGQAALEDALANAAGDADAATMPAADIAAAGPSVDGVGESDITTAQGPSEKFGASLPGSEAVSAHKPAETGPSAAMTEQAANSPPRSNVIQMRPFEPPPRLTSSERNAFREIAKALGARIEGDEAKARRPAPGLPQTEPVPVQSQAGTGAGGHEPEEMPEPASGALSPAVPPSAPEQPEPPAGEAGTDPGDASSEQGVPDASAAEPKHEAPATDAAAPEPEATPAPQGAVIPDDAKGIIAAVSAHHPGHAAAHGSGDIFASLLDKLPIGVLVLQSERMIYANRTLLDLLDHGDFESLAAVGAERLFKGGAPSEGGGVLALLRADGGHEPVDARLSSISWLGEPATLMSFRRALDNADTARIEALKLDLARAQAQARELSAILDTATDGVATLDERGRILSLNRSAEALFGYDQREVTGENFTLLLAPESHITALDYLEGLKGGGVAALLNDGREVQGRVRQGGRIPLSMTMGRVADGAERKYSAVLRDMTAWKRAEADLVDAKRNAEQASAQKSDVLAKISHEIRTPLNAILGFTEVMSEERFGPIGNERYKEYLTDIHQSGGYLISLINDLLDLAKIEAGKMDLTFVGVNLNDIAGAAVGLLQPEANRQRVVLRTGLQPKLPSVVADERSLRQIVINILSNAVKFTDAGGQVILSTALGDRGEVILRVRDTGIGMTEKELGLAMEPFRQVASTRRTNSSGTGGTGLGLPITKALVEANKGAIQITSAKNEGTLVEVTFPPQRVLAS